jgi:hypothetical protein
MQRMLGLISSRGLPCMYQAEHTSSAELMFWLLHKTNKYSTGAQAYNPSACIDICLQQLSLAHSRLAAVLKMPQSNGNDAT